MGGEFRCLVVSKEFSLSSWGREEFWHGNLYKYVRLFIISLVTEGARMEESKNITLKVKSKLYDEYREVCKKEGWIVSRQFEKLMEEELKRRGRV